MRKVAINDKIKPDWFTRNYPLPSEMAPDIITVAPNIISLFPSVGPEETFIDLYLVRGQIDDSNQCKPIPPITKKVKGAKDCNEVLYTVDGSGLGAIKSLSQTNEAATAPSAFVGVPNLSLLSISEQLNFFSPGAPFPLGSAIKSVPITFKKLIADHSNPAKLGKFLVEINNGHGNTTALIPVSPPATPLCQVSVLSPQPISLNSGNQTVQFKIQTDSVTTNAKLILPDGTEANFTQDTFDRYSMEGYGAMRDLKATGSFDFPIASSKIDDVFGQYGVTLNPNNPNEQFWNIIALVAGVDGITQDCNVSLRIDSSLPPQCILTANPVNPLLNEEVNLSLNCDSPFGGPVTAVRLESGSGVLNNSNFKLGIRKTREVSKEITRRVRTIKGYQTLGRVRIPIYQWKTVTETIKVQETYLAEPEFTNRSERMFTLKAQNRTTNQQLLTAVVTGLNGRDYRFSMVLGRVCPFNNSSYQATLFNDRALFSDYSSVEGDLVDIATDDLIYTTGFLSYTRQNHTSDGHPYTTWLYSGPADIQGLGNDFNYKYNGTYTYLVRDNDERCSPGHYCLVVRRDSHPGLHNDVHLDFGGRHGLPGNAETDTAANRQYFWVEVGLSAPEGASYNAKMAADINAVKRDPACRTLNTKRTKFRVGGCFASSTQIMMADGSHKKASEIEEDDWVLNPHYKAPVRVKKVVKGPEKKSLWEVKYENQKVVVTEDHPFLTQQGWVQTVALKAGEVLVGDGKAKKVLSVKKLNYKAPDDVWNFELDTDDTYGHMVLANGIPTGDLTTQLNLKIENKRLP